MFEQGTGTDGAAARAGGDLGAAHGGRVRYLEHRGDDGDHDRRPRRQRAGDDRRVGAPELRHFYTQCFIDKHPPDTVIVPLTRTVGQTRIVEELFYQFTQTIEMPWMLP